jgi:hypothetical protein
MKRDFFTNMHSQPLRTSSAFNIFEYSMIKDTAVSFGKLAINFPKFTQQDADASVRLHPRCNQH